MVSGHFVDTAGGRLFVTQYGDATAGRSILLLPSLFEELNLCRAIAAKQAYEFTKQGYVVYCLDYFGCGDSEGEIHQANVIIWQQNIVDIINWITQRSAGPIDLWGIRFGSLMLMSHLEIITKITPIEQILLWKPVLKGKQFMTQFLRLKQANAMMQGTDKVNWRELILSGTNTEVAGYELSADLLSSIDALEMPSDIPANIDIHWLELSAKSVTPAITKQISDWPQDNLQVSCHECSAFWQIPEIFSQPGLIAPSIEAFAQKAPL